MMSEATKAKYLSLALYLFGAIFVVGIYAMMQLFTSGWTWEPRQPEYEQMIMGMYAVLGIFMIRAAKNPSEHLSLIWFVIWSSAVHAAIMLAQALRDPTETMNIYGDIPALFLVAIVLWLLMPKKDA
jgi:hypothetical protein